MTTGCNLCRFVADLEGSADQYSQSIMSEFAYGVNIVWGTFLMINFMWTLKRILLDLKDKPTWTEMSTKVFWAVAVSVFLASATGGGDSLLYTQIVHPFRLWATQIGTIIIANLGHVSIPAASSSGAAITQGTLAGMFGAMEESMLHIIAIAEQTMSKPYQFTAPIIGNVEVMNLVGVVLGLILLLPWVFVISLFSAYLVECLFTYLTITCIASPIAAAMFFPSLRDIGKTAMKTIAGASLTIVFLGIAMGFTLSVSTKYIDELACAATGNINSSQCGQVSNKSSVIPYLVNQNQNAGQISYDLAATPQYWLCFVMAVISIVLHMRAKALSSMLISINDGPGPAAAVLAGVKAMMLGAPGAVASAGKIAGQAAGGLVKAGAWAAKFISRL